MDMARKIGAGKRRLALGAALAIIALLVVATTAFAQGFGPGGRGPGGHGPGNGNGQMNDNGGFHGIRAVVGSVDTGTSTITLAGLPQNISTIKVDSAVKLVTLQADGTTQPAQLGDFKAGALVEVGFARGQKNGNQGSATPAPAQGQGRFNVTVNQIALVPANAVRVEGLVLSTSNGAVQISTEGGLRLNVKTDGNTKYTKGQNGAAGFGDIQVGNRIGVGGAQSGDTITATTIRIADLSQLPQRGMMPGKSGMPGMPGAPNNPTGSPTPTKPSA